MVTEAAQYFQSVIRRFDHEFSHRPATHLDVIETEAGSVGAYWSLFEICLAIPKGDSRSRTTQHIGIMVVAGPADLTRTKYHYPNPWNKEDPYEVGDYGWLYLPVEQEGKWKIECRAARLEDFREGNDILDCLDPVDYHLFHKLCMQSEIPDPADTRAWAISFAVRLFSEQRRFRGGRTTGHGDKVRDGWIQELSNALNTRSGKVLRKTVAEVLERNRKRRRLGYRDGHYDKENRMICDTAVISDDEIDSDESEDEDDLPDGYDAKDGLDDYELEDELIDFWRLVSMKEDGTEPWWAWRSFRARMPRGPGYLAGYPRRRLGVQWSTRHEFNWTPQSEDPEGHYPCW